MTKQQIAAIISLRSYGTNSAAYNLEPIAKANALKICEQFKDVPMCQMEDKLKEGTITTQQWRVWLYFWVNLGNQDRMSYAYMKL